jgi:hypothetical protein
VLGWHRRLLAAQERGHAPVCAVCPVLWQQPQAGPAEAACALACRPFREGTATALPVWWLNIVPRVFSCCAFCAKNKAGVLQRVARFYTCMLDLLSMSDHLGDARRTQEHISHQLMGDLSLLTGVNHALMRLICLCLHCSFLGPHAAATGCKPLTQVPGAGAPVRHARRGLREQHHTNRTAWSAHGKVHAADARHCQAAVRAVGACIPLKYRARCIQEYYA